VALTN